MLVTKCLYKNKQWLIVYFLFLAFFFLLQVDNEEVSMRSIEAEKGLLKLVHPGRHIETHKEPIIASEVLKRNPRHSVARPDVFEYPWIVVRPESMLNLGRVFYIVPNLTIYKLIKEKGYNVQPSLQQKKSTKSYVQRQLVEPNSPSNCSAGTTPKHEDHCQSHWQQFQATCLEEASTEEQALVKRFNGPSQFDSLSGMISYQSNYKEFKEMSTTDSISDVEYGITSSKARSLKRDHALSKPGFEKQVTILKPCLRKDDSTRKLLHLKVSFSLSSNNEERKRKVEELRAESPVFFTCM